MSQDSSDAVIRLRGVRHNNLKGFDLDLPKRKLIVITGLSGSGKSSLAFDTLFAEGQRRYIETFSPYARQFFDRMDKPRVDSIEGIPPAIAIEQRNAVRTTRSTVGTMTEICDYMKVVWPHLAQLHCRGCGKPVRKDTPQTIWDVIQDQHSVIGRKDGTSAECLITFDLPLSDKLSLEDSLALIEKQGYQRLLVGDEVVRLDEALSHSAFRTPHPALTIIQDRLRLAFANRARFIEACEQAYHFGKGRLAVRQFGSQADTSVPLSPALSIGKKEIESQRPDEPQVWHFSRHLHCAACDIEYREPTTSLFSFNNPVGACPSCKGFGRIITIDYNLAVPDRRKSLNEGVVKPWQTGTGAESQADLKKFCKARGVRMDVPFCDLPKEQQDWVIEGDKDYGIDEDHQWPRLWYGVKGYFRWLESKAYKMHVRVLLSRYRAYRTCSTCDGQRFQPDALLYLLRADGDAGSKLTLADFYALPLRDALGVIDRVAGTRPAQTKDPIAYALNEVRNRIGFLVEVGLGYLTSDRTTRSLSGGETERVNLTTCLGSGLVNALYVLDEPSVGLHARDTDRLVRILHRLRDTGNTVVVVEHEAAIIRAADQVVDLGPAQGEKGGQVVFQGDLKSLSKSVESLTGAYLNGRKRINLNEKRPVAAGRDFSLPLAQSAGIKQHATSGRLASTGNYLDAPHDARTLALNEAAAPFGDKPAMSPVLQLTHGSRHNLKNVSVEIPLNRLVCVSGVSGSGKTTLIREVLFPLLRQHLDYEAFAVSITDRSGDEADDEHSNTGEEAASDGPAKLTGWESLGRVLMVDQASLGKTPRSNPAVYIGAFDAIREFFAQSEAAKQLGLISSHFSFNSPQGQCERCRGAGFEKIEMQFLSDVFIRCPDCDGRRYREHVLSVKIEAPGQPDTSEAVIIHQSPRSKGASHPLNTAPLTTGPCPAAWSIGDMLEATVDDAIAFLGAFTGSRPAQKAVQSLTWLKDVGLGYLRLGQPINTLSGGECQRLKLVKHLADSSAGPGNGLGSNSERPLTKGAKYTRPSFRNPKPTFFLFDEPTTGLHFDDVRVLIGAFQRLVDAGHSVLVIEHNLDVIRCSDWVIDLGPDAGDQGGEVVVCGTPDQVASCKGSHTGLALAPLLGSL